MHFLLPWMEPRLDAWKNRPIHPHAPRDLVPSPFHDLLEVTLARESEGPPEPAGPYRRASDSVLAYRVFGPRIGTPVAPTVPVRQGDTIGLRYKVFPGLAFFFASRVVEVFRDQECGDGWRSGFIYQTLSGHPELGEEVFEVTKHRNGNVTFRMEAWSRPNLWYVKLFTPLARRIQKHAARCAADYLSGVAADT